MTTVYALSAAGFILLAIAFACLLSQLAILPIWQEEE